MKRVLCLLILTSIAATTAPADEPAFNHLKLRSQATVYGEAVTLGDVLIFTAADAALEEHLAEAPVGTDVRPPTRLVVTHDQVVSRLGELGVNLARVLLGGALRCEINVQPAAEPTPAGATVEAGTDAAPLLRSTHTPAPEGTRCLSDVIRSFVNTELAEMGGTADLRFERAGEEFLELTTPPWDFKITSSDGASKLGLREFRVLIRRDGRVQRTARIFANVQLTRQVVVARRPLGIGNAVRRDDIGFETRVFGPGDELGVTSIEQVVGQQVRAFVPAGELIPTSAVKAVDLVQRSRPVTVVNEAAGVEVRLSGVALDSGTYGDTVRVRLGDARKGQQLLRGVVTGLGTVRLEESSL